MSPLRPFQKRGVEWLLATQRGVLADDMGLGKTVQAIFALRTLIQSGEAKQVLVVCPGILVPNWLRELEKWSPELGLCVLRPPAPIRNEAWRVMKNRIHVLLATYEQVRVASRALRNCHFDVVVLDEAHRLRNPTSKTASVIRQVICTHLWALTGTPIERHPSDLLAILSIVAPGRISRSTARLGPSALRSIARPHLLRRQKRDVLEDLPQSDEQAVWLELTPEQRRAYDVVMHPTRNIVPLARLARLRKICDLDADSKASSKLDFLTDRAEEIVNGLQEKAVVFSLTLAPLFECRRRLLSLGISAPLLTGRVSHSERELVLREFREGKPSILLASAKLASEGLNLTEANHVFFLNLWWNPSANHQARDRVLRIGQQKKVNVWSLLCADTVDEELYSIVQGKEIHYSSITDMLREMQSVYNKKTGNDASTV